MNFLQDAVQNILSASSDAVVIAGLIAGFTAYGLFFGKSRLVTAILSLYPAAFIFKLIPFFQEILKQTSATPQDVLIKLVIFVLIFIPIHLVMNHFISAEFSFSRIRKFIEAGILGVVATSTVIAFSYQVINISKLYNFSSGIDSLFISGNFFWWLVASFVALFFLRK